MTSRFHRNSNYWTGQIREAIESWAKPDWVELETGVLHGEQSVIVLVSRVEHEHEPVSVEFEIPYADHTRLYQDDVSAEQEWVSAIHGRLDDAAQHLLECPGHAHLNN